MALESIDADALRGVVVAFSDALTGHREAINNLNVYPVPDGDTGTNMSLTLRSVVEELDANGDDMASVCGGIAHGSLMGARGNSGVILSQILRGFSAVAAEHARIDGALLAEGLTAAAKGAYTAVGNPVEGTILTVIRESAQAATDAAAQGADLCGVLEAARGEAAASLERTPTLLQVLADAGVVDAGGAGLVLLYDAALNVVDDRPMPEPAETSKPAPHRRSTGPAHPEGGPQVADLRYEVMFLLDAPDPKIDGFKQAWAKVGDSIVVVGDGGVYNCHIHCDDIGAAIECGIEIGRPHNIRVTDLLDELAELEERDWVAAALDGDASPPDVAVAVPTAVVAVGAGTGVVAILKSMGVHAVVAGGQSMNPSTAELVAAVESVAAPEVIILPNNKNIIAVARQVEEQTSRTVEVVATTSVAEALASLMAYDPQATASVNAASMAEAFSGVTSGEVTRAVRDAVSDAGPIATGDWLGIAKTGIKAVEPSLAAAATGLLAEIVDEDHELLTVITGEGSDHHTTALIESWISQNHPGVEVEVHQGGQPLYPYFFGLE
ncbi:MAG: DAK2 domain-containing protein [Acidimicrobiaceae bacterium]|nr:DAK2 domain-containing protein [Acidimicrobiaceae bacterium]